MTNYKGQIFNGNNRKNTRGRRVSVKEFTETKKIEKELGWYDYTAVKHLVSVDPRTGKEVYAKQGKAVKGTFHCSLPKDTILKGKRWGIKHWVEQESTNITEEV